MLIYYFIQRIICFPLVIFIRILTHLRVIGQENSVGLKGPIIIALNHKDYIDGIVFVAALPFKTKLLPIRSLVWYKIYYLPILHFLLKISGNMPIAKSKDGNMEEALKTPLKILKKNGVVVIFPEGGMVKKEELGEGKRGVSYLALKANVQILPVSLRGTLGASFKNLFLGKSRVTVSIGKPFYLSESLSYDNKNDLIQGSNFVMEKIKKLYYNNEN